MEKSTDKKKDLKKINPKGFDPKKYVELEPRHDDRMMNEQKSTTVVIAFGRFNPPTVGHEKLVEKVKSVAAAKKADPMIFASHSQDKKKNPLSYEDKIHFLLLSFGLIVKKSNARTIIEIAKSLSSKYENFIMVAGSDRVESFQKLLNDYNGKEYNFKSIEVVSAGERDPDADDDISAMSASKMRSLAANGDFEGFKKGLPKKLKTNAKEVYDSLLKGMKLMEDFEEEYEDQLDEKVTALDFMQRLKRSMVMKRYKGKIAAARKRAQNRRASPEKLKDRARKRALSLLRDRLSKAKSYGDMSASEKNALDQRLSRIPSAVINRIATKQLPVVKKIEMDRFAAKSRHESVNEEFEKLIENFRQESNEVNENIGLGQKPVKRFHRLFNGSGKVHHDRRFKMYKPKAYVHESAEDIAEEIYDLMESTEDFLEACWKGYQQFGMKKKGKRQVPNCIPVKEGQALDMVKGAIEREKEADKEKHRNMLDNARKVDNRRKSIRTESNEIVDRIIAREKKHLENSSALKDFTDIANKSDKADHLSHAEKIIKTHDMSMSAKDLVNLYNRIHNAKHFEKSYAVFDAWESVDKNNPANREYGTDSLVKILKSDTPGESTDKKFEAFLEGSARGFEGKMVNVPNVPVRLMNGKIKSLPSGKSSSSKGGDN